MRRGDVYLADLVTQARRSSTTVAVSGSDIGLSSDGFAICHQITTLDRSKLLKRAGSLGPSVLAAVEEAIRADVDIE